ncbi:MAG: response regulator [Candidatus Cloacimonetes bacterium HGW-Cloacimonetes-2]|jgi:two-component system response regulator FlrC|nr:MAG: response regulator [Candidatus Cloacimonetes bacterium HGW-Cloacimonetes-2]
MSSRILLVDDDRLLREVIGEHLSAFGFDVDLAEDGEHAYAKFMPGKYKLAIIDLMMPGMNGLELMHKLLEEDDQMFCLIMTGYPTIDSAYKSMVEGASDYIIKPFQLMELINIVQKYIK